MTQNTTLRIISAFVLISIISFVSSWFNSKSSAHFFNGYSHFDEIFVIFERRGFLKPILAPCLCL